jgi:hypothetical protein
MVAVAVIHVIGPTRLDGGWAGREQSNIPTVRATL